MAISNIVGAGTDLTDTHEEAVAHTDKIALQNTPGVLDDNNNALVESKEQPEIEQQDAPAIAAAVDNSNLETAPQDECHEDISSQEELAESVPMPNDEVQPQKSAQANFPLPYRSSVRYRYASASHISPQLRRNMLRHVRRRWRRERRTTRQTLPTILLGILLIGIVAPFMLTLPYDISAYTTYSALSTHATDGIQQLLAIKAIFTNPQQHTISASSALDPNKLIQARTRLTTAHTDFMQVKTLVDQDSLLQTLPQVLPQFQPQVKTARAASQIGVDVTSIGLALISAAQTFAPKLHGPLLLQYPENGSSQETLSLQQPLSSSILSSPKTLRENMSEDTSTPLITASDLTLLHSTLDHIQPLLDDVQVQSRSLALDTLPISAQQRNQIKQYVQLLPQVVSALQLARTMIDPFGWFLGVNQPRSFLVQTMDRSELRPSGGFTGQYGELHINGGRMAPLSLQNIALLEYAGNSPTYGNVAPAAYRSWWPFANWGLRDSNLSADFPTTAHIAIDQYKNETGQQVDGVILFSSQLIEQVLQVTGPVSIPEYHETVTAQNLEQKLHYYQDGGEGISIDKAIENVSNNEEARKLFTSRLASILMGRIRQASSDELLTLGQLMLSDMQSRDLEIYVNNAQLESLLTQYNDAAQMDRSTTHDGLYVVQANVSASKASTDVRTTINDTVTLDATGGATHLMQMRLAYTQVGDVYGLDTYRDYIRVYVPPSAQFRWGDGFDTGTPLCSGPFAACPTDSIYPGDELLCPTGLYLGGASAEMLNDPYTQQYHPLDEIGPPTNFQSDEPGRGMFGGYVVIPKDCTLTVTLSWYVPPAKQGTYSILVQRQSGTFPELNLTVLTTPTDCTGLYFDGVLTKDASFSLQQKQPSSGKHTQCSSQMPT